MFWTVLWTISESDEFLLTSKTTEFLVATIHFEINLQYLLFSIFKHYWTIGTHQRYPCIHRGLNKKSKIWKLRNTAKRNRYPLANHFLKAFSLSGISSESSGISGIQIILIDFGTKNRWKQGFTLALPWPLTTLDDLILRSYCTHLHQNHFYPKISLKAKNDVLNQKTKWKKLHNEE